MSLVSLLVTRDQQVIDVLRTALEKLSVATEVCGGVGSGHEILQSEKFDAVLLDCDDLDGGLDLLQSLRKSPSNKNSVSFAILNGKTTTQAAFDLGAKFVLQKPISPISAAHCFCASLSFMIREQRRYFRQSVELPVHLEFGRHALPATATNLSDGGMAVRLSGKLPEGSLSGVSFSLSQGRPVIEAKATLAWVEWTGRAGIRFLELSNSSRQLLGVWLDQQMAAAGLSLEDARHSCNEYSESPVLPSRPTNPT